ncbi:MAG: hypothetical protein AB7N76_01725 [Planctomycetota bacterium]
MKRFDLGALILGLACLTAAPVFAQPADPFEAIVSNPDGAEVKLDDLGLPARNPTGDEVRQYLEAFRAVNLNASFTVDDGTRREKAGVYVPVGNAKLGPFSVENGTKVHLNAGFTKRPGESEAVLRTLEFVPENPMAMGPLRFNKMVMDERGVLHMKLNLKLMGFDFWPQEMTIEKIYRDAGGNLVFQTGGTGLAGKFVPDIRITPDGRVQRYSRGIWFFGWRGAKWKDLEADGQPIKVESTLPIDRWPPRATDILNWLPQEPAAPAPGNPLEGLRPVLDAIPVKDLSVAFRADADPRRIELSDGRGHLDLTNHSLQFDANGSFEGRTFKSDPTKANGYRATAHLEGEVKDPSKGSVKVAGVDVELSGKHRVAIPFDDLDKVEVEASLKAKASGDLRDLDAGLPGMPRVHAERASASFDGEGTLVLRPYTGDPKDKKELTISRDSRYGLKVEGPVELSGMKVEGATLPESMVVRPVGGKPVLEVDGDLGTKMGFVFARTNVRLEGETAKKGLAALVAGDTGVSTTLREGARVSVKAYAFAGMKKDTLEGGGVRVTADARISGQGEGTRLSGAGFSADLPGVTELNLRAATNTRYGTKNGAEAEVRSLALGADVTLKDGEGTLRSSTADGGKMELEVGEGTRLEANSGLLRRTSPTSSVLETEGYARGEKAASFKAHLVLTAGSVAQKDLALSFRGKTTIDLDAAIGFRLDPRALQAGALQTGGAPVAVDLNLAVDFQRGSALRFAQPSNQPSNQPRNQPNGTDATLTLAGATRITLHAQVQVDPSTGKPTLKALEGIDFTIEADALDLKAILSPLGQQVTAQIGSRTTVRIEQARVELLEQGLRIHHNGVRFEIAAGTIDIGTRR